MAASKKFPMGVRFHPTDEEKVDYLLQFITTRVQCDEFIRTDDLYGEKEPWEVFENYDDEDRERHFFTKLKKVGKKMSTRYSCNVGKGTWSNKGQKTPIYGRRRRAVIGYKRFRYKRRKDDMDDNRNEKWLLKEYILLDLVNCQVKEEYRDHALCVLKKKAGSNEKKIMIREPDQEGTYAPMDDNMMIIPYQMILTDKTNLITISDDDQTCFNQSMIMTPHNLVSPCRILADKIDLLITLDDDHTCINQSMMMPRDLVVRKEIDHEEEEECTSASMDNMISPYQVILADKTDLIIISDEDQTCLNQSMMTPHDLVVRKKIDDEEEELNEFFNFTLPADNHFLSDDLPDDHFVSALTITNYEPLVASE